MDPSADSLHTGNLIGLVMLRRFQQAGHHPIALAGGATGMVGDPGGRSEERNLLDEDTLRHNVAAIKAQIARVLGPEGEWTLVDNYDWTRDVPLLAFLRDVGKHVTVNQMLARESVRARIESEHGISYTEFSYMLLQAYDYWWLHEHHGCELQIGGSDQWGNILSGVDLIRRRDGVDGPCAVLAAAHGGRRHEARQDHGRPDLARPEPHEPVRAVPALHPDRRPPGPPAAGVVHAAAGRRDRRGRGRPRGGAGAPAGAAASGPGGHGHRPRRRGRRPGRRRAPGPSRDGLDPEVLRELEATMPTHRPRRRPSCRSGVVDLLVRTGLAASKSAAARLDRARAGRTATTGRSTRPTAVVDAADLIDGRWLLLRAGKRHRHLVVVAG